MYISHAHRRTRAHAAGVGTSTSLRRGRLDHPEHRRARRGTHRRGLDRHRTRSGDLRLVADASGVKLGFVDLHRRTWYLPETKSQRDLTIHLSNFAMRHFQALAALREFDPSAPGTPVPWVFPRTGSGRLNTHQPEISGLAAI